MGLVFKTIVYADDIKSMGEKPSLIVNDARPDIVSKYGPIVGIYLPKWVINQISAGEKSSLPVDIQFSRIPTEFYCFSVDVPEKYLSKKDGVEFVDLKEFDEKYIVGHFGTSAEVIIMSGHSPKTPTNE